MENLQSRDAPGAQVRARMQSDLRQVLGDAGLSGPERSVVLEYVEAAHTRDTRTDLGGARSLIAAAEGLPASSRVGLALRRLATRFVHP